MFKSLPYIIGFLLLFLTILVEADEGEETCEEKIQNLLEENKRLKDENSQLSDKCVTQEVNDQKESFGFGLHTFSNNDSQSCEKFNNFQGSCEKAESEFSHFKTIIEESKAKSQKLAEIVDWLLKFISEKLNHPGEIEEIVEIDEITDKPETDDDNFQETDENIVHDEDCNTGPIEEELENCQNDLKELSETCESEIDHLNKELKKKMFMGRIPRKCRNSTIIQKLGEELYALSDEMDHRDETIEKLGKSVIKMSKENFEVDLAKRELKLEGLDLKEELADLRSLNEVEEMGEGFLNSLMDNR